jgi:hypothetical protein
MPHPRKNTPRDKTSHRDFESQPKYWLPFAKTSLGCLAHLGPRILWGKPPPCVTTSPEAGILLSTPRHWLKTQIPLARVLSKPHSRDVDPRQLAALRTPSQAHSLPTFPKSAHPANSNLNTRNPMFTIVASASHIEAVQNPPSQCVPVSPLARVRADDARHPLQLSN